MILFLFSGGMVRLQQQHCCSRCVAAMTVMQLERCQSLEKQQQLQLQQHLVFTKKTILLLTLPQGGLLLPPHFLLKGVVPEGQGRESVEAANAVYGGCCSVIVAVVIVFVIVIVVIIIIIIIVVVNSSIIISITIIIIIIIIGNIIIIVINNNSNHSNINNNSDDDDSNNNILIVVTGLARVLPDICPRVGIRFGCCCCCCCFLCRCPLLLVNTPQEPKTCINFRRVLEMHGAG